MTERERFLRSMRFQPVDRLPFQGAYGIWNETVNRWRKEGFRSELGFSDYFGYDRIERVPVNLGFVPPFDVNIIENNKDYKIRRDEKGILLKERSDNPELSMPQYLKFPVEKRSDFEGVSFRIKPDSPERFPREWKELCLKWEKREIPLYFLDHHNPGFFGPLRDFMGLENLLYTFFDDPSFIEEMMDAELELLMGVLEKVFSGTSLDYFMFWEDMAFKGGPLISPEMFRKYMTPRYKVVTDYLRAHDVDIIGVDSDGNINELIPLWLDAGINFMFPCESQSGMDIVKLRKEYGRDLLIGGGINKYMLSFDEKTIDDEIYSKLPYMIESGGYIVSLDHSVPPDVSFKNYLHYNDIVWKIIRKG